MKELNIGHSATGANYPEDDIDENDVKDIPTEYNYLAYKEYFKSDKKSRGRVEKSLDVYREAKLNEIARI